MGGRFANRGTAHGCATGAVVNGNSWNPAPSPCAMPVGAVTYSSPCYSAPVAYTPYNPAPNTGVIYSSQPVFGTLQCPPANSAVTPVVNAPTQGSGMTNLAATKDPATGKTVVTFTSTDSSVGVGYQTRNGSFSNSPMQHQVTGVAPDGTQYLATSSIDSPGAYKLQLSRNSNGSVTYTLTLDKDVDVANVNLGGRNHSLKVDELNVSNAVGKSASDRQPTTPASPPSTVLPPPPITLPSTRVPPPPEVVPPSTTVPPPPVDGKPSPTAPSTTVPRPPL